MNAKEVLDNLSRSIADIKSQGQEVISVAGLEDYIENLKQHAGGDGNFIDHVTSDLDLATLRAKHETGLADYNARQKYSIEVFRSIIAFAQSTLKSSILINGGAGVALLAFIGKIWSEEISQSVATALIYAIVSFSFGVLAGAIGVVAAYLTQYSYDSNWMKLGVRLHIFTVIAVIAAHILFGIGIYEMCAAFYKHLSH